jgi:DNA-directed RNA polymerase subunit N (RpoN/RPB10)
MIIPIKCFTCGKVLADKWNYFKQKSAEMDAKQNEKELTLDDLKVNESNNKDNYFDTNKKGHILDELGLTKICCRRHMLGHVDLIDII